MTKVLSDPMQIGIAAKNDHDINLPFLMDEPEFVFHNDEDSYGYYFKQYIYDDYILTTYQEGMCHWFPTSNEPRQQAEFLFGRLHTWPMSGLFACAWIANTRLTNIEHKFYNKNLWDADTSSGRKVKTAHRFGFDNWSHFKKEHDRHEFKPITIINATK